MSLELRCPRRTRPTQYIHLLFFVQIVMGIPTSVSQTTPETSVAGLRNHLTSDLVPNRSVTRVGIPIVSSVTHFCICIMLVTKTNKNRFHLFSKKDKKSVLFWSQEEIEWVVLWEALIRSSRGSSQNIVI
jgi:hypothetical protein